MGSQSRCSIVREDKFTGVAPGERGVSKDRKVKFVMYLFSDGPREYDFLLRILSLGRDWYWRKHVIDAAGIDENDTVLDIACGTGLLSYQFAGKGAQVVGVDVTREMLTRARALPSYKTGKVELIQARAEHLPFRSEVFEAATISLATRNVSNIENTFGEMQRCTKEGKKIISMDFTRPKSSTFRPFYYFYIFRVLPSLGLLISRHWNGIFLYLANSIKRSKTPEQLAEIMESIGMSDLSIKRMTQGTTALVSGTKRAIPTYSS